MISRACSQGCPCEDVALAPAPGPVGDAEFLVKVAFARADDFEEIEGGGFRFAIGAFREQDLRGPMGKRSVSVIRQDHLSDVDCAKRAAQLEPAWQSDPVVGRIQTLDVRALSDLDAPRLLCVYAEPTGDEDRLGALPAHAGIVRARKLPDDNSRLTWFLVRVKIAQLFGALVHLSGRNPSDAIRALRVP